MSEEKIALTYHNSYELAKKRKFWQNRAPNNLGAKMFLKLIILPSETWYHEKTDLNTLNVYYYCIEKPIHYSKTR